MYTNFFGLTRKPFSLLPDPDFLFLSTNHKKALSTLQFGLTSQSGITVLTGELGSGKTTILKCLTETIGNTCKVGVVTNTLSEFGDLFTWLFGAFNIRNECETESDRYRVFTDFVRDQNRKRRRVVLFIDEAQNIDIRTLEELRLLTNINTEQELFLQVFLIGQPDLMKKLNAPELVQLSQRISIDYHLKGLSFLETQQYIQHRLKVAGAVRNFFDVTAMAAVYFYSAGIPRLINNLCDLALVYAFAKETNISWATISHVVNDRKTGLIRRWLQPPEASAIVAETHSEEEQLRKFIVKQTGISVISREHRGLAANF